MAFEIGDTVRLKSGGPVMTVKNPRHSNDGLVWCNWFPSAGKVEAYGFAESMLEKYPAPKEWKGIL